MACLPPPMACLMACFPRWMACIPMANLALFKKACNHRYLWRLFCSSLVKQLKVKIPKRLRQMETTMHPASSTTSLLEDSKRIRWIERPSYSSLQSSSRRVRILLLMLLLSFVFLTALVLALAAPQHKRQVNGPVIGSNFQDPSVVQLADGSWMAYAGVNGNPAGVNILVASSTDFSTWTVHDGWDALPSLPSWAASPPHVWAPDVTQLVCAHIFHVSAT